MPTNQTHPAPTHDEISARARRYYEEAGAPAGRDDEFWHRAEQDLREQEPPSNDPRTPAPASTPETSASSGEELS
jgi:hypothetical protein